MVRIKGWKKKITEYGNHSVSSFGYYYVSDNHSLITFKTVQDRDGRNAFIHTAFYNKTVIARARNEYLVKTKAINYMRSHPNG